MRRFGYARDPLCIAACACYATNHWLLPAHFKGMFLREHFDDMLLIPAALPLMLWLQRPLGLRLNDAPPGWAEIGLHLAIWSVAAEVVAPLLFTRATADIWDVAAYAAGAAFAGLFWQRK